MAERIDEPVGALFHASGSKKARTGDKPTARASAVKRSTVKGPAGSN